MAKRNLNEVLGFISRWGDSDFSLTLLENEEELPDQKIFDKYNTRLHLGKPGPARQPSDKELNQIITDPNYKPEPRERLPGEKVQARRDEAARAAEEARQAKEDAAKKAAEAARRAKQDADKKAAAAAAQRASDEEAVEKAGKSEKEPGIRDKITSTLRKIGLTRLRDGGPNIFDDELSGGIEGTGEKLSLRSRMLGKISDVAGKAGETAGMIGAISGMGTTLGQGIIQMNRAQTGKKDVMGASVGGFTKTVSGIGSGLDRIAVGADRLEDESQIKQATQKIEAEMRQLRANRLKLTPQQQKIAAERYKELEQARQDVRSKNRFSAARMRRMFDILNTGRTTPRT